MSASLPPGAEMETGSRKRRRVSVACRGCRARKSRCDGARPNCSPCSQLRLECVYEQPAEQLSRASELGNSSQLEARLQALEDRFRAAAADTQAKTRSALDDPSLQKFPPIVQNTSSHDETHNRVGQRIDLEPHSSSNPGFPGDSVDGMAAVFLMDDEEDCGYFGASSNIALFKRVSRAVSHVASFYAPKKRTEGRGLVSRASRQQTPAYNQQITGLERNGKQDTASFPPDEEATMLVQEYFATVGLMLPCLHEDSFLAYFKQARRQRYKSVRKSWLAQLNMVFALVSNTMAATSPMQSVARMADTYFQQAVGLTTPDLFTNTSLEIVQLLSLMETYLQGTQRSMQAWSFHGLAVKAALQLGLQSAEASRKLPLLEREMRKRTWHWCIINDVILSVKFGRPPMIHNSIKKMDLPHNINIEFPASNKTSALIATSVSYYTALITLSDIMGETLEQLYGQNLGFNTPESSYEIITRSFSICWKLGEFQRDLPSNLQIMTSSEMFRKEVTPLEITRFRMLLSLRYLGARVLATRPILNRLLDFDVDSVSGAHELSLLRDTGSLSLRDCVQSCTEITLIVGMITREFQNNTNLMGAWWYSAYYTFNASLVIFGVLIACKEPRFEGLFPSKSLDAMRSSLDTASEVLQGLDNGNLMISRCRDCLKRLLDVHDTMHKPTSDQNEDQPGEPNHSTTRANQPPMAQPSEISMYFRQPGSHLDVSSALLGYDFDTSSFETETGFGSFGGLVMSADLDFLNHTSV